MVGAGVLLAIFLLPGISPPGGREARIERLQNALLAPCCYAEPVSRHRSDAARKMRDEIAVWVAEGRSDREILDHYKRVYGARVLIEPEGALRCWAYIVPSAAVAAGFLLTVAALRRWSSRSIGPPRRRL